MPEKTEKIQQEIMADADRKVDRTLKRARRDADKLREKVKKENEELRARRLSEAKREAGGKARAIIASIPYEERRIKLLAQEQVFNEVFNAALDTLGNGREPEKKRQSLKELLDEALASMPDAGDLRVAVNPRDEDTMKRVAAELAASRSAAVETDDAIEGGVVALDASGRLRYDNSFRARFEREHDTLRAEIREILAPAAAPKDEKDHDA